MCSSDLFPSHDRWCLCGLGWVSLWVGLGVFIGLCYGFSATDPVNREYCYLAADGKVYFSDVNIAQKEPQNVFVIYKN